MRPTAPILRISAQRQDVVPPLVLDVFGAAQTDERPVLHCAAGRISDGSEVISLLPREPSGSSVSTAGATVLHKPAAYGFDAAARAPLALLAACAAACALGLEFEGRPALGVRPPRVLVTGATGVGSYVRQRRAHPPRPRDIAKRPPEAPGGEWHGPRRLRAQYAARVLQLHGAEVIVSGGGVPEQQLAAIGASRTFDAADPAFAEWARRGLAMDIEGGDEGGPLLGVLDMLGHEPAIDTMGRARYLSLAPPRLVTLEQVPICTRASPWRTHSRPAVARHRDLGALSGRRRWRSARRVAGTGAEC